MLSNSRSDATHGVVPSRPPSPGPDHLKNKLSRKSNSPRRSGSTPHSPSRSSRNSKARPLLPYGMLIQREENEKSYRQQLYEKIRREKIINYFLDHYEKNQQNKQQMDIMPRCHEPSNIQTSVPAIGRLPTPTRNQASPPTNE
jgi:hypothetical protein